MSQRDCRCPGLVTPTLDELLAVARSKPLPRVRIRERRPPPAELGATLKGWMSWSLVDRRGREVRAGEGPNLILNQGLDLIATTEIRSPIPVPVPSPVTNFPIIRYAAVGTDSSTPDPTDTGLGAEVARIQTKYGVETVTRPSPGVYHLTRSVEFDYDQGNGVLTEWGFSSAAAGNLFNRALFTDSNGDPDAVTKTDQEKLRLTYTLEIALSPIVLTAGSFTVTNVGVINGDYMLIGGPPGNVSSHEYGSPDLQVFSHLARGSMTTFGRLRAADEDFAGATYATEVTHSVSGSGNNQYSDAAGERDVYSPGSFQRTGGYWRFDTARGNHVEIDAFAVQGPMQSPGSTVHHGYVFTVDEGDRFGKDDEHRLLIGVPTVTWGRA